MLNIRRIAANSIVVLLGLATLLSACSPPPPPPGPPGPPTSATGTARGSGATYTVTVKPVGPTKWTYAVSGTATSGSIGFDSIQFHSTADIHNCTVTLTGPTPVSTLTASNPAQTDVKATFKATSTTPAGSTSWVSGNFTLECDMSNGEINVMINDVTGTPAELVVIGPVAGPVK